MYIKHHQFPQDISTKIRNGALYICVHKIYKHTSVQIPCELHVRALQMCVLSSHNNEMTNVRVRMVLQKRMNTRCEIYIQLYNLPYTHTQL